MEKVMVGIDDCLCSMANSENPFKRAAAYMIAGTLVCVGVLSVSLTIVALSMLPFWIFK